MQYVPFASDIEIPFYASLASHKINHDKLDDSARKILGIYETRPSDAKEHSCRMQIHGNALTNDEVPPAAYKAEGIIKNVNTIEDYRNLDKISMLQQAGRKIWDAINDGTIYDNPSLLASFLVISFADLKKYRFQYWFAFPALAMDPPWAPVIEPGNSTPHKKLNPVESTALVDAMQKWRITVDQNQYGFFLVKKNRRSQSQIAMTNDSTNSETADNTTASTKSNLLLPYTWQVGSLSAYDSGFFEGEYSDDCYVGFADPSNYTEESGTVAPGWMLRNLSALIRQRWKRDRVQILCYRETQQRKEAARSVVFDLVVSNQQRRISSKANSTETPDDPMTMPKVVGWERNAQGKLAGRFADLTEYMDPKKLADSSVDLNLKLMKWRLSPNLNLDKIKETKCLLLGAGTLGSYVSRNLLGWGVRKITFVDNGSVSFSNPVRQPLFNFQDCLEGGKKKAIRAAEALKEIYPGVDATGYAMSVPMVGHPVTDAKKTEEEFNQLERLIKDHDAIFLLMDSRESRWLPTVLGKAHNKIVMNAALGFDTYVVMRHGVKPSPNSNTQELGCYFCNDVVAPGDSMKDLTLDQQCTVTRPGIAAIASALLVEILVSLLQHPDGPAAPAPAPVPTSTNTQQTQTQNKTTPEYENPLGLIPHQIRGFLSTFTNLNIIGRSYDCCSACSDKIVNEYLTNGWMFVEKALNDKGFVEELSGLKEVQRLAEEAAAAMEAEMSDEDDDGFGVDGEDVDGELV